MKNGLTEFGKSIKFALIDKGEKQKWLIDEVKRKTGLYFDTSYLCKVMTGKKTSPKIISAIKEILALPE